MTAEVGLVWCVAGAATIRWGRNQLDFDVGMFFVGIGVVTFVAALLPV